MVGIAKFRTRDLTTKGHSRNDSPLKPRCLCAAAVGRNNWISYSLFPIINFITFISGTQMWPMKHSWIFTKSIILILFCSIIPSQIFCKTNCRVKCHFYFTEMTLNARLSIAQIRDTSNQNKLRVRRQSSFLTISCSDLKKYNQ